MAGTTSVTTLRGHLFLFAGTQTKTQLHLDAFTKTNDLHFIINGPSNSKTDEYFPISTVHRLYHVMKKKNKHISHLRKSRNV